MRKVRARRSREPKRLIEDMVRIIAKLDDVKKVLLKESKPIPLGFCLVTPEQLGVTRKDVPIPFFENWHHPTAKILDPVLWIALREGNGDADKVWMAFEENLHYLKIGFRAVEAGSRSMQAGFERGRDQRVAAGNKYVEYRRYFMDCHLRNPQHSYPDIVMLTAQHFKISKKTISRATATLKF